MTIEVKVPALPESVADATIATWHKKVGDVVTRDENILDLETDKVVLEVPAPADGVLQEILFKEGDTVHSGELLARIGAASAATSVAPNDVKSSVETSLDEQSSSPAVRRMMAEHDVEPSQIKGTGKDGRITKDDVVAYVASHRDKKASTAVPAITASPAAPVQAMGLREERRVPMSRLRAKVAERLLQAQHNAAMLTTFNEVNLQAVMDMRAQYKDSFEKKHGVKLGFMSFFTKAVVESLKRFPAVNASIDGQDILYHGN